jgi:heme/copper-type cytochrome/quinol oxidase subunit 2
LIVEVYSREWSFHVFTSGLYTKGMAQHFACHSTKKGCPLPYQLTFQEPVTPSLEGIIDLHREVVFYIIIILWMLIRIVMLFAGKESLPYSRLTHHDKVEWV